MWKTLLVALVCVPLAAQQPARYKIAVVGLVHSQAWGHLKTILESNPADAATAQLVGVAEPNAELIAEAKKAGVADNLTFADYTKMLDKTKPDLVWSFVENNRHLEIAKACATRHIHLIFEKPVASNYEDAKQIRALAAKYNIRVMTNYQMAWRPAAVK